MEANRQMILTEALLKTIGEYTQAFGACPMRILSAKFSRALSEHGGFNATIDDLKNGGLIRVYLARNGAKSVVLGTDLIEGDGVEL